MQAKDQEGDEIEERGPGHRIVRTQNAGRNDSRDRIRGIIHAVEKIECQRDQDHPISSGKANVPASIVCALKDSNVLDNDAMHHVGDVVEAVNDLLQMVVDFVSDKECQSTAADIRLIKFAQTDVVQFVGTALDGEICAVRSLIWPASALIDCSNGPLRAPAAHI